MKPIDANELENRLFGCLLGGAIGDALGLPYEGSKAVLDVDYPSEWSVSDDTQLTLATCESLIECGQPSPEHIAATYVHWYQASKLTGLGASTLKALTELSAGGHWALVGRKGEFASGNGAAMRIAPLSFMNYNGERAFKKSIRDVCWITHQNDEAYIGALAVVLAIRIAMNGDKPTLDGIAQRLPDSCVRDRMIDLSTCDSTSSLKTIADQYGSSGYVVESVPLAALTAERIIESSQFETHLVDLIQAGGDTDTNASMAGQIAGTYVGADRLPQHLVQHVPLRQEIIEAARKLAEIINYFTIDR